MRKIKLLTIYFILLFITVACGNNPPINNVDITPVIVEQTVEVPTSVIIKQTVEVPVTVIVEQTVLVPQVITVTNSPTNKLNSLGLIILFN